MSRLAQNTLTLTLTAATTTTAMVLVLGGSMRRIICTYIWVFDEINTVRYFYASTSPATDVVGNSFSYENTKSIQHSADLWHHTQES